MSKERQLNQALDNTQRFEGLRGALCCEGGAAPVTLHFCQAL